MENNKNTSKNFNIKDESPDDMNDPSSQVAAQVFQDTLQDIGIDDKYDTPGTSESIHEEASGFDLGKGNKEGIAQFVEKYDTPGTSVSIHEEACGKDIGQSIEESNALFVDKYDTPGTSRGSYDESDDSDVSKTSDEDNAQVDDTAGTGRSCHKEFCSSDLSERGGDVCISNSISYYEYTEKLKKLRGLAKISGQKLTQEMKKKQKKKKINIHKVVLLSNSLKYYTEKANLFRANQRDVESIERRLKKIYIQLEGSF